MIIRVPASSTPAHLALPGDPGCRRLALYAAVALASELLPAFRQRHRSPATGALIAPLGNSHHRRAHLSHQG
jgi:hypothetical protein